MELKEWKERRVPSCPRRCSCARLSPPRPVFEEPGKTGLPTRSCEMAIEDGTCSVAVLNVLFGITTVVIIMKLRRERDAHTRQLEILYGAYTKTVWLKNMDTSKEGHMVSPAFEAIAPTGGDLEAGPTRPQRMSFKGVVN